MNVATIDQLKVVLRNKLFEQCGEPRGNAMSKANFLQSLWYLLASFAQHNRRNSLIQSAALKLEHDGDLVPRAFLILSVLCGSYPRAPDAASILADFIDMLDKDLDKEELRVWEEAEGQAYCFFPELRFAWRTIREVYSTAEFDMSILPRSPYHAYALFVLERPEIAFSAAPLELVFEILSVLGPCEQATVALAQKGERARLTVVK